MSRGIESALRDTAFFAAAIATAFSLGPALAHALELPAKIAMSQDDYFVVQRIYQGWDRMAFVLAIQLVSIVGVIVLNRRDGGVLRWAAIALGALVAAQIVFWTFTFPANRATSNWTNVPADWERLRFNWEYSHLAGAVFQVLCMTAIVIALLRREAWRDETEKQA